MKRAFLIVISVLLVISFVVYTVRNHRAHKARVEAEKAQKEMAAKNATSVIEGLLKEHDAFDWAKEIESRNEPYNWTPILTVELEKLWLTQRPTLFIGTIKDISTIDREYCALKLKGIGPLMMVKFELELKCPIQKINSLLEDHPVFTRDITNGVAVIANINNIKTVTISGYDGEKKDIRVGEGKCIDIVYIEDIWTWYHLER